MDTFAPNSLLSSRVCIVVAPSHATSTAGLAKKILSNNSRPPVSQKTQTKPINPQPKLSKLEKVAQPKLSNLEKIGERVREMLIRANQRRMKYWYMKQANVVLLSILVEVYGNELTRKVTQNHQDAAREMENILFSVGGADRLLTTLRIFCARPAIRELDAVKRMVQKDSPKQLLSKEEQLNIGVVDSLQDFFAFFVKTVAWETRAVAVKLPKIRTFTTC